MNLFVGKNTTGWDSVKFFYGYEVQVFALYMYENIYLYNHIYIYMHSYLHTIYISIYIYISQGSHFGSRVVLAAIRTVLRVFSSCFNGL